MTKFQNIKDLDNTKFRRLTGIKRETFQRMIEILIEAEKIYKAKGGRKNRLTIEDRLLMLLEYYREYRTFAHIGNSFGISESACQRNIRWIESVLIKHPDFKLPGKKLLIDNDFDDEEIIIDTTETSIE